LNKNFRNFSVILSMINNTSCLCQPWQAYEKTLGRPSEASFAPRQFSSFVVSLLRIRTILNEVKDLARPASRLGSEAQLRGFGIIDSFVYKRARDYGEVFYTVKATFSIKNEP
jgi:hypothetical protein